MHGAGRDVQVGAAMSARQLRWYRVEADWNDLQARLITVGDVITWDVSWPRERALQKAMAMAAWVMAGHGELLFVRRLRAEVTG